MPLGMIEAVGAETAGEMLGGCAMCHDDSRREGGCPGRSL